MLSGWPLSNVTAKFEKFALCVNLVLLIILIKIYCTISMLVLETGLQSGLWNKIFT